MPACVPFRETGTRSTGTATAPVTGGRFLVITGDQLPDGTLAVAHPSAAGARPVGVAAYDAPAGGKVGIIRGKGTVLPVTAGAALTAGQDVQVDAVGRVVPVTGGVPVAYTEDAATPGGTARVCLL